MTAAPAHFAARLTAAIAAKKTPLVVGIDPQWSLLPPEQTSNAASTLESRAETTEQFCSAILDATADLVPAVKFQLAFFEALGIHGLMALERLAQEARKKELLVIFDGKRNDIGSSAEGYAAAYLQGQEVGGETIEPWTCDALTVNPFLGSDGLAPFAKTLKSSGKGIFVLVRTSNPSAGQLQEARASNLTVSEIVAEWVRKATLESRDESGYGAVGAVVGATAPAELASLRRAMPNAILLIPGYGAQGGKAADIAAAFDENGHGAIVNSSRGIIYAYREATHSGHGFADAARKATLAARDDLAQNTPSGRLR